MRNEMHNLALPSPKSESGEKPTTYLSSEGPVVIVGANGSGKTRLGAWIEFESEHKEQVHRISAQKSLVMPASVPSIASDQVLTELLYGYAISPNQQNRLSIKRINRWRGVGNQEPHIAPLSDFDKLLTYLFSDANETNARYVEEVERIKDQRIEPPETKLRATKRVWEGVLPHRKLKVGGGKVETQVISENLAINGSLYNASGMSDGERVIFYLIGQAFSAPENGIIIIDEPELHLHRSIEAQLWDAIEAERSYCLFVYLTHDLDFAASRISATKVWLESYDGSKWDWHEVEDAENIPEQLYLEILGGRKPVLFCEGDKGSLDYFLFQKAYPDFTVAPCGSAYGVVQATRSFSTFKHLHNHACYGIVDRDFRDDAEVKWLQDKGVSVLDHSEIENVLLSEDVLRTVAEHQRLADNFPELLEKARNIVFSEMTRDRETLISSLSTAKVERRLKNFDAKARGKGELGTALGSLISSIDVDSIYDDTVAEVDRVIGERNYSEALRLYNNKGLLGKIEPLFGFARKGMPELVKRLASEKEGGPVLSALRKQLPEIKI
ncbi:MAG TPA: AAA family ATPase [Rubrobacteraceae bacterium]|nr:AAA family ATPase [Rubrobacteraceae bacterium]